MMGFAWRGLVLLLAVGAVPGETSRADTASTYNNAVDAFNSGRIAEAKAILEPLLREQPDAFERYALYWSALGRVENGAAVKAAVESAVAYFAGIPAERRNEDYYVACLEAYRILADEARGASVKAEAIAKLPRGRIAQKALLDAARDEKDVQKSAALLTDYLNRFDDNISWTEIAAHDLLELVIAHPNDFDFARLLAASEQAERLEKRFVDTFGQPVRYVLLAIEIAEALQPRDPKSALAYAGRGLSFIQDQWPSTEARFEQIRFKLWPVLLSSYAALEQWPAARTVGDALSAEIDAESIALTPEKESAFRLQYALALERTEAADEARAQRDLAADPEAARHRREDQVRRKLLGDEQHRPAFRFELKDLAGRTVRLRDFRGKVLVLSFWATWCGPCVGELDALKTAFANYGSDRGVAFAAVSIDNEKDVVPPFVEKRGYAFPILLSDGSVEAPFATRSIPRLFVIDRKGLIRFEATGLPPDQRFAKRLDWMIEAARR
jgi:peroxiredoxin